MTEKYNPWEENEISKNSKGGTEITKRMLGDHIPSILAEEFQIIPSRVRELQPDKIRIYWAHDLPGDNECDKAMQLYQEGQFHQLVFSSQWQLEQFTKHYGLYWNSNQIRVIETPIKPFNKVTKSFKDGINLVYFSTPHRGLELLCDVVDDLTDDNVHLHVFSSFKIYGWDDPEHIVQLFEKFKDHPKMTFHGSVEQDELRDFLEKEAHILAYPSIWPETSCRVLMESMSAGLMCVHPNYAALADTAGGLTTMYQFDNDKEQHKQIFRMYLKHAINVVTDTQTQNYLQFVKMYADVRFELPKIASQWMSLMEALEARYRTVESRQLKEKMFTYRV